MKIEIEPQYWRFVRFLILCEKACEMELPYLSAIIFRGGVRWSFRPDFRLKDVGGTSRSGYAGPRCSGREEGPEAA